MRILFLITIICVFCSCKKENLEEIESDPNFTIWTGEPIEFKKEPGADPTLLSNQDSITNNLALTRGNNGGEIYNAFIENEAIKNVSPLGTEWAIGDTSNIKNLTFTSFRAAVGSPQNVVGKNLVLHLIKDDVYLYVKFKSWANSQNGGFSYSRSTKN